MTTDSRNTVPDDGPSVSIVDTARGTVMRTRDVVGIAVAVMPRCGTLRHPGRNRRPRRQDHPRSQRRSS
jgi:hypothetical protein